MQEVERPYGIEIKPYYRYKECIGAREQGAIFERYSNSLDTRPVTQVIEMMRLLYKNNNNRNKKDNIGVLIMTHVIHRCIAVGQNIWKENGPINTSKQCFQIQTLNI